MQNWKTTATGLLSSGRVLRALQLRATHDRVGRVGLALAMFAQAGGLAAFGIAAKDYRAND